MMYVIVIILNLKIVDIIVNDDKDNNLILYGSPKDISKKLIENILINSDSQNFINSDDDSMPSPFSSVNNYELLIPSIIKKLFYSNLKEINLP